MGDGDRTKILIAEFSKSIDSAHYYDQMGWIIMSFFFIFVGALIGGILSIDYSSILFFKSVVFGLVFCSILFGLIVMNLFFKCQDKKLKEYKFCKKIGKEFLNMERYKNQEYNCIINSELDQFLFKLLMISTIIVLSWISLLLIIG